MTDVKRDDVIDAVLALVNAERWSTTLALFETRKALLWSATADEIFGELVAQNAHDNAATAQINWGWDILKAARRAGIPAAFERAQGVGARFVVPPEQLQLLQTALESGQKELLDDVLDRHPYLVTVLRRLEQDRGKG
jgi:hypothetical protein